MANANTIGPATRINGQLEADEDITVEGRIEGGPVRVRGRLCIAARGIVLAEETEVREALIIGVFVGTLRAQEVVRIHQDGRIVGDVIAPRVVFVSDKPATVAGDKPRATTPSVPPKAPRAAAAPASDGEPAAAPQAAGEQAAAPEAVTTGESSGPRSIPPLPGLGHRSMTRKE